MNAPVLFVLAAAMAMLPGLQSPDAAANRVGLSARDAIANAVRGRMGDVDVSVDSFPSGEPSGTFANAVPDPGATLGGPIWFSLTRDGAAPSVRASVQLRVTGMVHRAARVVDRGATLDAAAVVSGPAVLERLPLRPLPATAELLGARTLRPLAAGQIIERAFVSAKRVVNAGDSVTAFASSGALEVSASVIAADGGNAGDVIRVSLPGSRRYLRARILGAGRVEVVNVR